MNNIYLDHIAGTPVAPAVQEAMRRVLAGGFGNPQSLHTFGQAAREALEAARDQVARLVGARAEEIYFTASGTESNNWALKGLAAANQKKGRHLIISAIEHQSVLHSARSLEKQGFTVTRLPVDTFGLVDPDDLVNALTDQTALVSIMLANGEVGTIQALKELTAVTRRRGVLFHTDAVAAAGNIPVQMDDLGVDALSLAGSQFYGPAGAAALYVRKGTRILPLVDGGIQEEGKRAGTENLAGIAGLGQAAELAGREVKVRQEHAQRLRDRLIRGVAEQVEHVILTGHPEQRLPHHASFCVEFIEGEAMLLNLNLQGIAASSGSACTSRALKASHVLKAMQVDDALAQGSLVFGLGLANTEADIDRVLEVLPPIVEKLRNMSPLYTKFLKTHHRAAS